MSNILYTVILYPLVQLIEIAFFLFDKIFDNTGIAILGVSLTVTLLCLPLYIIAEKWQQTERDIQKKLKPGIDRIKDTFKGDEQYMILSTYYRQNHYHPIMALRSSFGLLIQIPFFMAAYSCLSNLPSLHGQSFLFIKDMGVPDAIFYIGSLPVNILPILMTLINIVAGAIYCKGLPFREKAQIYGMALLFLVILYDSPSGLVLYWTMNNVFSLIKNIFYKLKNPKKVLYILFILFLAFVDTYVLFVYGGSASIKKRLFAIICSFALIPIPLYLKAINWILNVPLKNLIDNTKTRNILFITESLALTILIGLLLPSTLISSSVQEFSNVGEYTTPLIFIKFSFWQAVGLFLFWNFAIYFLFNNKIQGLITFTHFVVLLCGIINVFLFTGNYGSMDVSLQFPDGIKSQSSFFIATNLLIIIVTLGICLFCISKKFYTKLVYLPLVTIISFTFLGIYNLNTIKKEYLDFQKNHNFDDGTHPVINLTKTGKNVIILMLDRAASSCFEYIIKDNPDFNSIYSGFTFYPNTVSYNGSTLMAAPPLYGGYEYTPLNMSLNESELLSEKHNKALLTIPRILTEQSDFHAQMFDTSWGNYSYISDMTFTNDYEKIDGYNLKGLFTKDFIKNYNNLETEKVQKLVQRNLIFVSFFRISPAILRPIVYYKGCWWQKDSDSILSDDFIDWVSSLLFLPEITKTDSEENNLIMLTNELTHSRNDVSSFGLLDRELSFADDGADAGYGVNYASIKIISDWINYLKENDVYDNSKIIIVSDHGIGLIPTNKKFNELKMNDYYKDSLNPLLLVKDFNSTGELTIDNSFMCNADVPVIVFDGIVENPLNPFTGKIINNDDKKKGILVTTDTLFMPYHSTSKYKFTLKEDQWCLVKDNIFDDDNWVKMTSKEYLSLE